MKVLVLFERSASMRSALSSRGHMAVSCDLQPCDIPGYHLEMDYRLALKFDWDAIFAFLPCTYTSKAALHLAYLSAERRKGIEWTVEAFNAIKAHSAPIKVIENPPGFISSHIQKPSLIIHPYQFGDPFRKTFCLWTEGLPPLMFGTVTQTRNSIMNKSNGQMTQQQRQNIRSSWSYYPAMISAICDQWFPKLSHAKRV